MPPYQCKIIPVIKCGVCNQTFRCGCNSDFEDIPNLQAAYKAVLECLGELYDLQNGCPLPEYEHDWTSAMRRAERLLGIEAKEPDHERD